MPDWNDDIRKRLAAQRLAPADEAAIIDEWAQHLDDRFRELRGQGLTDAEAYKAVISELEVSDLAPLELRRGPAVEKIAPGATERGGLFTGLSMDLRYAVRMLVKNPGFTTVVVLTLALGIGANTTVFTVINTLLLHPLPVHDPSTLLAVCTTDNKNRLLPVSYPNLEDYKTRNEVFSDVAAYTPLFQVTLSNAAGGERMFAELVSANYFETLGIHPAMGRFFLPEEGRTPGAQPVAVVGYGAWQQRFGAAPDIIGKTLRLNHVAFTVVGVGPPGFRGINAVFGPDVWLPEMMAEQVSPVQFHDFMTQRSQLDFRTIGRLRPGIGIAQAAANLKTIAAALAHQYPDANQGRSAAVEPLSYAALGDARQFVTMATSVLMAIVALVLLIACSNIANLLLARAAARRQEIATRLALGASRRRLLRQLLSESVVIALLGGALGIAVASEGCQVLWSFLPPEYARNFVQPRMDGAVFLFVSAISFLTGLIFGIAPALQSSRADVAGVLKEETRTAGRNRRAVSFGNVLLVGQVALSLIALVTAAVVLRAIQRASAIDPGFETRRLVVIATNPGQAGYGHARTEQFYREARDRVRALPGVAAVSWAANLPFFARSFRTIVLEGRSERNAADAITTMTNTVDLDYFETTRIAFVRGRDFTAGDREGSLPVAIVNDNLAAKYWPNQDAIGKRFKFSGENFYRQVIGIVKTVDYQALGETPQPCVYLPLKQNFTDWMTLYVRTQSDSANFVSAIQKTLHAVAPEVNVGDVRTGQKLVDQVLWFPRMGVGLLVVFGFLALALACVGLYGMVAYSVNRRRREIGVRMAMGAAQSTVLRLILAQGMKVVGVGVVLGLGVSLLVARMLASRVYGVSATDPVSFIAASAVLLAVAMFACYWPARQASRVDPQTALREA